jgi:NAD(P)-dependent dehydrogenase (short-subunit alcohol dehydrogenase family)
MELNLSGKRALITGASQGIGRAVAMLLADEGCDLVLVARNRDTLQGAADAARARRQIAVDLIPADLSEHTQVERAAAEAGPIDILVNCAGAIPPGDLLTVDDARWRAAWDLKVFGFIGLARALYPVLQTRAGVIVNIIGAAGEWLDPNYLAGSTGNAALMAFTRALGKSAARDGMRVVGINPGPVATGRMEMLLRARAARELADENRWTDFHRSMPFGRPASPEEIAAAVAFLASPRSGYTNGTILTIDGGRS